LNSQGVHLYLSKIRSRFEFQIFNLNYNFDHCTELRFASFFSGGYITAIVVNSPERKFAKRTSVHCTDKKWTKTFFISPANIIKGADKKKLGAFSEKEVLQILKLSKSFINKKKSPKLIFLNFTLKIRNLQFLADPLNLFR
jgi:hypothetical protein